ncbi:MAG: acyl carrier protein [Planctomycetota bacterium]|jgi:acyl carrier protein|nr:acyl carrier protein [Planctomycetota bacterium]|tara:strand:+ start:200 stop:448 length:249 start_codon:yes stop_codon:yes gene_type:complete
MTRAEIEAKVIDIVSTQLGVDKVDVTLASSFASDLNADSLDTVELVMELEDAFSTSIPDEQAEQIQTVGNAVDFIASATDAE